MKTSRAKQNAPNATAKDHQEIGRYRRSAKHVATTLKAVVTTGSRIASWLNDHSAAVTALATVAIAVLTVFYVVYSRAQWNALMDSNTITRASSDAAVASTRAWIAVQGFPSWKGIGSDTIHLEAEFRNVGKTPALNVEDGYEFPVDRIPVPGCPSFTGKPGVLSADQRYFLSRDHKISADQLRSIIAGKSTIYVHGCLRYTDVLSPQQRITEFCVKYNGLVGLSPCGPEYTKMN